MSQVLPRRVLVAVAILTLLGAALALAVATRPQTAQAQAGPAHDTEVFSNIVLATNSIGEIHLGPGTGSVDVLGAGCNPAGPRGGGNIPGQMVTDFRTTETILRVFHLNGTVLANKPVRFTCTVDFGEAASPVTAALPRQELPSIAARRTATATARDDLQEGPSHHHDDHEHETQTHQQQQSQEDDRHDVPDHGRLLKGLDRQ